VYTQVLFNFGHEFSRWLPKPGGEEDENDFTTSLLTNNKVYLLNESKQVSAIPC
jgi:hypothetical protein